jgi:hypothetical protein
VPIRLLVQHAQVSEWRDNYRNCVIGKLRNCLTFLLSILLGDSGSPVMLSGTTVQVGINSYSNAFSCDSQTLDIYTRISFYYDWIQDRICDTSGIPPTDCAPSSAPSQKPTLQPTLTPSAPPTLVPSIEPSATPSQSPTQGVIEPPCCFLVRCCQCCCALARKALQGIVTGVASLLTSSEK